MVEGGNHCSATMFQASISKLRRPLDSLDLEDLPDSRERAEAPVLWHRQGLQVAAPIESPIDLRTKKAESFTPQLIQGFWQKLKKNNPKNVGMSPTFETKDFTKEEMVWQQYHLCVCVARTLPYLGPESGKIWWLKKVQYYQKMYHCQWTLLRGKKPKWISHNLGNLLRPLELGPASRERVVPTK